VRRAIVVLLAGAILAHAGIFRCGWHLDDNHTIVRNEAIGDLGAAFRGLLLSNRGLGNLTFTLNWLLSGSDTFFYHLANLLIHLANGLLVLAIARKLAPIGPRRDLLALGAGALFLFHPLATNSVTYIVQRYTSLATFFYLLAIAAYLRGREGRKNALLLAIAAALAASRTKEIALTLPLVLAWTEWVFPHGRGARRLLRVLPFVFVAGLIPATLVGARLGLGEALSEAMRSGTRETAEIGRIPYFWTQMHVVTTYLRLLVLPYGLTLDHDYPLTIGPDAATLAKALFLGAIAAAALWGRRRTPLASFGGGWFFLTLLVESSVFPIRDVIFEHRTYLPSVGFFFAAADLASRALRSRRLLVASLVAASVALGVQTSLRNRVWKDEITLWTDCAAKAPRKARPRANLAYAWIDLGEKARAREALEEAIRIGPAYPEDLVTLAELRFETGDLGGSEEALREALRLRPEYGRARRNLAQVRLARGDEVDALREAEEAVRREPTYAAAWLLLGRLRLRSGDAEGAARAADEASRVGGSTIEAVLLGAEADAARGDGTAALHRLTARDVEGSGGNREDLARVIRTLSELGDIRQAIEAARLGATWFPTDSRFPYYAGASLLSAGRPAEAAEALQEAREREPDNQTIRGLLALSLARAGRSEEAAREARSVLQVDPLNADAKAVLEEMEPLREGPRLSAGN